MAVLKRCVVLWRNDLVLVYIVKKLEQWSGSIMDELSSSSLYSKKAGATVWVNFLLKHNKI